MAGITNKLISNEYIDGYNEDHTSKIYKDEYIDYNVIKKKYEMTDIYEPSDILESNFKEILSDFSPDKPMLSSDTKRENKNISNSQLRKFYGGNDNIVYKPDMMMGDLTPDPRSIHEGPLMGKYRDQILHRKDNYRWILSNDDDKSVHSSALPQYKVNENKVIAYKGLKERFKNFTESNTNQQYSNKNIFTNKSLVDNSELDNKLPDVAESNNINKKFKPDNYILEETLPTGWLSVPDEKIKIAGYDDYMVNRKHINNPNVLKNKMSSLDDRIILNANQKDNNNSTHLSQTLSLAINNKKSQLEDKNSDSFKISKNNENRTINTKAEHMRNNDLKTTEYSDDKISKLADRLNLSMKINNIKSDFRNNISELSEKIKDSGNNKEIINLKSQLKDKVISDVLRNSVMTNKIKDNNKETNNSKSQNIADVETFSNFIRKTSLYTDKRKNNNISVANYSQMDISNFKPNRYKNLKEGLETNPLGKVQSDQLLANKKITEDYKIQKQSNFKMDTDFNNQHENIKSSGQIKKIKNYQSKYDVEKSTSINDDSINDGQSIHRR